MTQLASLPGDVLAFILHQGGISSAVIALWKTGNPLLQTKLAKSITRVDLNDNSWHSTSRWPKCLTMLRNLQHLSINRQYGYLMSSAAHLSAEIRRLSPTLRSLSLESADSPGAFFNYALDGSIITTGYTKGYSRLFDVQAAFPVLDTLYVRHVERLDFSSVSIPAEDFPGLPDTLTSLFMPYHETIDPSHLPRALLSLDSNYLFLASVPQSSSIEASADSTNPSLALISSLPPTLTSIKRIQGLSSAEQLLALPRSLLSLDLAVSWSLTTCRSVPTSIHALSLQSLAIESFPHGCWAPELPRTLTSLTLRSSLTLHPRDIMALPCTLTKLKGDLAVDWAACEALERAEERISWPPHLTTLDLEDPVLPESARFLPPTLTKMRPSHWQTEQAPFEPRGLNSASFPNLKSLRFSLGALVLESLPKALTSLEILSAAEVAPSVLLHLPATITRLRLMFDPSISYYEGIQCSLPLGLHTAHFSHWHFSWLDRLPFGLDELRIHRLLGFPGETASTLDFTKDLPTTLRHLMLKVPSTSLVLSGRIFSSLIHLEFLEIIGPILASFVMSHLSCKLWYLQATFESLEEEDCVYLPPNLQNFDVVIKSSKDHSYLVYLVPESVRSALSWSQSPDMTTQRSAHIKAAEDRSRLYPDP